MILKIQKILKKQLLQKVKKMKIKAKMVVLIFIQEERIKIHNVVERQKKVLYTVQDIRNLKKLVRSKRKRCRKLKQFLLKLDLRKLLLRRNR